jgi:hypothetical protein
VMSLVTKYVPDGTQTLWCWVIASLIQLRIAVVSSVIPSTRRETEQTVRLGHYRHYHRRGRIETRHQEESVESQVGMDEST